LREGLGVHSGTADDAPSIPEPPPQGGREHNRRCGDRAGLGKQLPTRLVTRAASHPQMGSTRLEIAMTDPTANILASFSSAIAALAAKATPSIVSVHSRRSRATGFVFKARLRHHGR